MDVVTGIGDIIKNIGAVSANSIIKVVCTSNEVLATAMAGTLDVGAVYCERSNGRNCGELPSVVCYGRLRQPIDELVNCTIGLRNLSIFEGFAAFPDSYVTTVIREMRGETLQPIEARFDYAGGVKAWYRLLSERAANNLVKVPAFNGATLEVTSQPKVKGIKLLKYFTAEAAKSDKHHFWAGMNARGRLYLSFDDRKPDNNTDRFEFDRGLPFAKLAPYRYPAKPVLEVLNLAATSASVTMSFSNSGCLKIEVDSGLGNYQFVFLGSEGFIWQWGIADEWPHVYHVEQMISEDRAMHHDWEPNL